MGNKIKLLPGEQNVLCSDDNTLTLTTMRVRYDSVMLGRSHLVSITLNSVASCGLVTKSYPLLLIIGAIALLVSLTRPREWFMMGLVTAIVLLVVYFFTRRSVISIASNGGESILAPTNGMNRDNIVEFIESVERQKLK